MMKTNDIIPIALHEKLEVQKCISQFKKPKKAKQNKGDRDFDPPWNLCIWKNTQSPKLQSSGKKR